MRPTQRLLHFLQEKSEAALRLQRQLRTEGVTSWAFPTGPAMGTQTLAAEYSDLDMESPCVNICRINAEARICAGCGRTLDEIADWTRYPPARRRAIMNELPARRARAGICDANTARPQHVISERCEADDEQP